MPIWSCQAILFDMDGTLIDSTAIANRIWAQWAQKHGVDLEHILAVHHGRRASETLSLVAPHLNNPEQIDWLHDAQEVDTAGLKEIPGAEKLLDQLPAGSWAVVTSATRALAEKRLHALGFMRGQPIIAAEDVQQGKPAPDCYRLAAQHLNRPVEECIVIEDAPAGLQAGKNAQMRTIGLLTTHRKDQLVADAFLEDLQAIELIPACGLHLQLRW